MHGRLAVQGVNFIMHAWFKESLYYASALDEKQLG
jgi:hypothetical protein